MRQDSTLPEVDDLTPMCFQALRGPSDAIIALNSWLKSRHRDGPLLLHTFAQRYRSAAVAGIYRAAADGDESARGLIIQWATFRDHWACSLLLQWARADYGPAWQQLLTDSMRIARFIGARARMPFRDVDVDDLAQTAMSQLLECLRKKTYDFNRSYAYQGYLGTLITRELLRHHRLQRQWIAYTQGLTPASLRGHVEECLTLADEVFREFDVERDALRTAMSSLQSIEYEVLLMHLAGCTFRAIASALHISVSTAHRIRDGAMNDLKGKLCFTPSPSVRRRSSPPSRNNV